MRNPVPLGNARKVQSKSRDGVQAVRGADSHSSCSDAPPSGSEVTFSVHPSIKTKLRQESEGCPIPDGVATNPKELVGPPEGVCVSDTPPPPSTRDNFV